MDRRLRQLEQRKHEEPEAWLQGLVRAGMLGPTNLSVLGMLGYQPAVSIMGGVLRPSSSYTYWYDCWYDEGHISYTSSWTAYSPKIHRIWFFSGKTVWMLEELKKLSTQHRKGQEKWLEQLENRQQFLGVLLKAL